MTLQVTVRAVRYEVSILTPDDTRDWYAWSLYVEDRGDDWWAISLGGQLVLGKNDDWGYESSDNRSDPEWRENFRYTYKEAMTAAMAFAPVYKVNGKTAADIRQLRTEQGEPL